MVLKVILNRELDVVLKQYPLVFLMVIVFFLSGCASSGFRSTQQNTGLPAPEKINPPDINQSAGDSRINASHSLTRNGYLLLCEKDYDGAIRLLEKAVGINPSDGPGYFYLSEAWIGKKNYKLAFQFNRLALMYLRDNHKWTERTRFQKKAIDSMR